MSVQLAEYSVPIVHSIQYKNNRGRLSLARFSQCGKLIITTNDVLGDSSRKYLAGCPEEVFQKYVENTAKISSRGMRPRRKESISGILCGSDADDLFFDEYGRTTISLRLLSHINMSPKNPENEVYVREVYGDKIKFFEILNKKDLEAVNRQ
jgi:hypothetical protein